MLRCVLLWRFYQSFIFCWWGGGGGGGGWLEGKEFLTNLFISSTSEVRTEGPKYHHPSSPTQTSPVELCKKAIQQTLSPQKSRFISTCSLHFPLFSFLDTTPLDKPPEQVSSYQVAPTFCNKSIPSNPKLQLNFLNTELVKPGIRRRGEEGEKFCSFSRQDWERRSAGMLSVLIKRWCIKQSSVGAPTLHAEPGAPSGAGFLLALLLLILQTVERKGSNAEGRTALSTWKVRPGDIKAQQIIHSVEGSSAAQQRRRTADFYAARRWNVKGNRAALQR